MGDDRDFFRAQNMTEPAQLKKRHKRKKITILNQVYQIRTTKHGRFDQTNIPRFHIKMGMNLK